MTTARPMKGCAHVAGAAPMQPAMTPGASASGPTADNITLQ